MAKKRVRHHVNPLADRTEHRFDGFSNNKSIIVDIGADRGEFTQQLLEKWGDKKNFIVSEIRKPLARKLEQKFEAYDNVVVFDGDIVRNFENIIKPAIDKGVLVEEIYINFPDPWFKERHKKRRVINKKFIERIYKWMPQETRWIFQTDQKQLFDETIEVLKEFDTIELGFFDISPHNCTTKWERAKIAQSESIYRSCFYLNKKNAT